MRLHLIESSHGSFQAAECAAASLVVHASLIWLAVWMIATGPRLTDGPGAAPLFLAPPDRREAPHAGQTEQFQLGQAGGFFADGPELAGAGTRARLGGRSYGRQRSGERSSAIGLVPFGQTARPTDSVFTMLEVDRMVERYEASAAPIYPPRLSALGREGHVQATFVVDTTGTVDMTSVRVLESDDAEFSASVRTALAGMRFRPATRGRRAVRQLVEQRFNFRIAPTALVAQPVS